VQNYNKPQFGERLSSCWSPTNSASRRNLFRWWRSPGRIQFSADELLYLDNEDDRNN